MIIKKFNENWMHEEEHNHDDIVAVSNILANAYNEIGTALNIEIDNDSEIFHEIEEFIVTKYKEMRDVNSETNEDEDDSDVGPGYDMSAPSI